MIAKDLPPEPGEVADTEEAFTARDYERDHGIRSEIGDRGFEIERLDAETPIPRR